MAGSVKPRVMIADDEDHCRLLLKAILKTLNCVVVAEARNGEEAVRLFKKAKPHMLFLDVNMPRKTGNEVLQEVRQASPNAFVVMLTSVADLQTVEECVMHGASNYILKDTPVQEIKKIIVDTWRGHLAKIRKNGRRVK